jgi:magnesium transporter
MIVDCAVYERGRRRAGELALEDAHESLGPDAFVWIGLYEPSEREFDSVRREFDLHELAVEDAIKAHQRPKLELYGDSIFLVLKTARWEGGEVELGEILLFVGEGFIVSVRHGETALHEVRLRLEERPDLLRCGPGAALHAIVDKVVDDYEPVIEQLEAAIEAVETEVFSSRRTNPAERIYSLKREVLEVQSAVLPLLGPVHELASVPRRHVNEEIRPYFRDVHDHLLRVGSRVQEFRELLMSVLTANLTQTTVRQNEDVRKISAWAAIVAVPTMIAGIYGMNFEHMPELEWRYGYPLVLAVIGVACLTLYRLFRRAGWL